MTYLSKTTTLSKNYFFLCCYFIFFFVSSSIGQDSIDKVKLKKNDSKTTNDNSQDSSNAVNQDKRINTVNQSVSNDITPKFIERRTEYYTNGQNGMELIARKSDSTVVVSTFDSRPVLKEAVAQLVYKMFDSKKISKDSIITFEVPNAIVTGLCKVATTGKFTNLSFYFQKIYWENGLTEIHQGAEFVAKASSAPFVQPKVYRRKTTIKRRK